MNEREIKRVIMRVLDEMNAMPIDEIAANLADRWHEAVEIARKEAYVGGHEEGYRDGLRDGRDECQAAANTAA